jgi:hypothetical protein
MKRFFTILFLLQLFVYNGNTQTKTGARLGYNISVAGNEGIGPYVGFHAVWFLDVDTYKTLSYRIEFKLSSTGYRYNENAVVEIYQTSFPLLLKYDFRGRKPKLYYGLEPSWVMGEDHREQNMKFPYYWNFSHKDSYLMNTTYKGYFNIDGVFGACFPIGKLDIYTFLNYGIKTQLLNFSVSVGF